VSRYQKGKTNLDFTEARDSEWQWHQLGHMQVCTSPERTMPATHHSFFTGRMPFLPPNQQRQSTEGIRLLSHSQHPSSLHSFIPDLKPSFSANPSDCILLFLFQD